MDRADDHELCRRRVDIEEQLFAGHLGIAALAHAKPLCELRTQRIGRDVLGPHQALLARRGVRDNNDGSARGALGVQLPEDLDLHGYPTFSTKTRIVPPQDRPTFQAVSSATPNSSIFGLPLSITSIASVTTAPSTQPPDTDPRKLPSLSMTRFEPTGRGADPQVSTTVASATSRPPLRHSSAAFRMSSSRESINILHHATCFSRSFGL